MTPRILGRANNELLVLLLTIPMQAVSVVRGQEPCDDPDRMDTTKFERQDTDDSWHLAANWSRGVPTPNMIACVPTGEVLSVNYGTCSGGQSDGQYCRYPGNCPGGECVPLPPAEAAAIRLLGPENQYNIYHIFTALTLHGHPQVPSRVNGYVRIEPGAALVINGDVTMEGNGGVIEGEFRFPPPAARPRVEGSGRLTIMGDAPVFRCLGGLDHGDVCYPDSNLRPPNSECREGTCTGSLMLTESLTIDVELINNANIVATEEKGIGLTGRPKSGAGNWWALSINGSALLSVECDIVLPNGASWEIGGASSPLAWRVGPSASLRIEEGAALPNLTGPIRVTSDGTVSLRHPTFAPPGGLAVSAGYVSVDSPFTTSLPIQVTGGEFTVTANTVASGRLTLDGGNVIVKKPAVASFGGITVTAP